MKTMGISRVMTGIAAGILLGMLAVAGGPPEAQATSITYSLTGTVSAVSFGLTGIDVGDTLSGSYTFESTTAPRAGATVNGAVYDAVTFLTFTIDSYTATLPSGPAKPEIQVENDPGGGFFDRYAVVSRATDGLIGPPIGTHALNTFSFRLDDTTDTAFSTALTLPTNLSLSSFSSNAFFVFFDGFSLSASGTLTSLRCSSGCAAVPEPASLLFLGLALVALGIWRRTATQA